VETRRLEVDGAAGFQIQMADLFRRHGGTFHALFHRLWILKLRTQRRVSFEVRQQLAET
jgi:hypothetical protein